ncbi:MAG TPA: hypothetical protein VH085_00765, partial [Nocardioides sp.]|nr:hypothetical protein [Nocardioides sp.]
MTSTLVLLFSLAGLTVLAQPPAQAGGAEWGTALSGAIYNSSGYDLSLVQKHSNNPLPAWKTAPSPLITNGSAGLFELNRGYSEYGGPTGFCFGTWQQNYDGWFTYEADVVDGGPEYITLSINGL